MLIATVSYLDGVYYSDGDKLESAGALLSNLDFILFLNNY